MQDYAKLFKIIGVASAESVGDSSGMLMASKGF
jgi:hypothetical protein